MSRVLGQWELQEKLASSGSGEVWLARDKSEDASPFPVAVKLIHPDLARHEGFIKSFLEDARLTATLSHPSLVHIVDLCKVGDEYFVVMELVMGESLSAIGQRLVKAGRPVPVGLAAWIIAGASAALHHAHQGTDDKGGPLGIAHKGLRPSNVLVTYEGVVKVSDFGVTAAATQVPALRARIDPRRWAYVSPEQCLNTPLDARSDVFALGVLLWELLRGARLFDGTYELAIKQAVCQVDPQAPSVARRDVPETLDAIVLKALAKDPGERFEDCQALELALRQFAQELDEPADAEGAARFMRELFSDKLAEWRRRLAPRSRRTITSPHSLLTPAAMVQGREAVPPVSEDAIAALLQPESRPVEPTLPQGSLSQPRPGELEVAEPMELPPPLSPDLLTEAVVEAESTAALPPAVPPPEAAPEHLEPPPAVPSDAAPPPLEIEALPPATEDEAAWPEPPGLGSASTPPTPPPALPGAEPEGADPWDPLSSVWHGERLEGKADELLSPLDPPKAQGVDVEDAPQWPPPQAAEVGPTADERRAAEREARRKANQAAMAQLVSGPRPVSRRLRRTSPLVWNPPRDGDEPDIYGDVDEDEKAAMRDLFEVEAAISMPAARPLTTRWQIRTRTIGSPVADVVRWRGRRVLEDELLQRPLDSFGRRGGPVRVRMGIARAAVRLGRGAVGHVNRAGSHPDRGEAIDPMGKVVLRPGDAARVRVGDDTYSVRVFHSELPPRARRAALPAKTLALALGLALAVHAVGGAGISVLDKMGVQVKVDAPPPAEKFADVRLQKVKALRKVPDDPPKPEKKKRVAKKRKAKVKKLAERRPPPPPEPTEAPPPAPAEVQTTKPRLSRAAKKRVSRELAERTAGKTKTEQVAAMFKTPNQGAAPTLEEAVSNVQAVKAKGPTSAIAVAGSQLGDGTEAVKLAVGGGGDPGTVSGPKAVAGVAKLEARKEPKRVRGTVKGLKALAKVRGELSKSEVLSVIGKHSRRIARCYERELMTSPGLSGKITFGWNITTDGRVSGASQKTSNLGNAKVSSCILAIIRKMKFPKPKGGSVQVVYPFIFRSSS